MSKRLEKKRLNSAFQSFALDRSACTEREYDRQNWYMVKDNPISKVGIYPYTGQSMRGAKNPDGSLAELDDSKVYNVLRSDEALSDPIFIDSLKLKPWIDDHEMLGGSYKPAEEKGVEGVIGEQVYFEDDTLYANLQLFSNDLDKKINGGKKELSLGYLCDYVYLPGVYKGQSYDFLQINLRANHIASVKAGRMGSQVAVKDSEINEGNFSMNPEEVRALMTELFGEHATAQAAAFDSRIESVVAAAVATALDESEATKKEVDADREERAKKKKAEDMEDGEKSEAADSATGLDAEAVTALVESHPTFISMKAQMEASSVAADSALIGEVYDSASPHIGAFDHADMSLGDILTYSMDKMSIACDHEDTAVKHTVFSAAVAQMAEPKTPIAMDAEDAAPVNSSIANYAKGEM